MAKKKISIRTLDRIATEGGPDQIELEWHGEQLVIDYMLTLGEAILFIDSVVNTCMDPETGEYKPELYDFSLRSATAALYTNVSVPENAEHQYRILYKTDLIDTIKNYINMDQYEDMLHTIVRKLRYKLDMSQSYLTKKVDEAARGVEKVASDIATIFADVTSEDMQNLAKALGNGFDEDRLVQAILGSMEEKREEKNNNPSEDMSGE